MGCNCKKINSFEEKFGVAEEESLLAKFNRLFYKMLLFTITIALSVVVIPCIVLASIYKIFWGKDNKLILPRFMRKYME